MEPTTTTTKGSTTASTTREDTSLPHVPTCTVLRQLTNLSTHPLVSASAAAYVLGILYLPRCILSLLLSPVLVTALLLLATVFYFGSSSQHDHPETHSPEPRKPLHSEDHHHLHFGPFLPPAATPDAVQKHLSLAEHHHFVEWPRWGPLEVIYEEYEGEEEGSGGVADSPGRSGSPALGRRLGNVELEGLSLRCYSDDSDGDSAASSNFVGGSSPAWELPEDLFFRWDTEEEDLIEIALEEDSLIEIDISACR